MINQFILKISRPIALAIWIITLLLFFLRLASGQPFPEPENGVRNLNQFLLLVSVVLAVISLAFVILPFRSYLFSKGTLDYEISINETSTSTSEKLAEHKAQLYTLGFQDFAAYDALSLKDKQLLGKVRLFINERRTICVELVEFPNGKCVLAFITDYPDKFSLQTTFNNFSEYTSSFVFSRSFMKSLSTAFNYHLRQEEHFSKTHGQAKLLHKLADTFDSVEDRQNKERSQALYYLRMFLKLAIALLIFGFTQYFLAETVVFLIGAEAMIFIYFTLTGFYFWFFKDIDNYFFWFTKNEEDRQNLLVAQT